MTQSPALRCVTTRCVIVNIARWLKHVATRGLDATHHNAGPCVYCEPALSNTYIVHVHVHAFPTVGAEAGSSGAGKRDVLIVQVAIAHLKV